MIEGQSKKHGVKNYKMFSISPILKKEYIPNYEEVEKAKKKKTKLL